MILLILICCSFLLHLSDLKTLQHFLWRRTELRGCWVVLHVSVEKIFPVAWGFFLFLCAITGFISILAVSLPVSMKVYWLILNHCMSLLLEQCFSQGTSASTQIYSSGVFFNFNLRSYTWEKTHHFKAVKTGSLCFVLFLTYSVCSDFSVYYTHRRSRKILFWEEESHSK